MNAFLLGASIALCASFAFAAESSFLVNQTTKKGSFDLAVSRERKAYLLDLQGNRSSESGNPTQYRAKSSSTVMSLGYSQPLSEKSNLNTMATFAIREFQAHPSSAASSAEASDSEITGFRSLTADYRYGQQYDSFTAVYGGEVTLSPGPTKEPIALSPLLKDEDIRGNNSLGYHALSPYVGIESYVGDIAVGATAALTQYIAIAESSISSRSNGNNLMTTFKGFIEIPVDRKWDIGLSASVGRADLALDKMFFGSSGTNETSAQAYADYKLDNQSSLTVHLKSEDRIHPYAETNSDFGLTFKKGI